VISVRLPAKSLERALNPARGLTTGGANVASSVVRRQVGREDIRHGANLHPASSSRCSYRKRWQSSMNSVLTPTLYDLSIVLGWL
jgi:hypothetical protein